MVINIVRFYVLKCSTKNAHFLSFSYIFLTIRKKYALFLRPLRDVKGLEIPPIIANFTQKIKIAMVEEAKEIEKSESPAVRLMRLSYIERIGTLLGIMIGEDISPRKSIVNEFHVSYDTIRNFLNFDSKIKIETILKFCYIIGHYLHEEYEAVENYRSKKHIKDRTKRLGRINQLQREYKEIYGAGAEAVEDLIKKKVDLRQFVNKAE